MAIKIKDGQTMLFIGNSITDCERRGAERPLGNGYVKLFSNMLKIREVKKKVAIINKGISGDTVTGLQARWTDDVFFHKPEWLSIKIGINDLHKTLGQGGEAIPPKVFRNAYSAILSRTKSVLPKCQILIIEPFYISAEEDAGSFRKSVLDLIPEYIEVVREMSKTYDTRLVKSHEMFQTFLKHHEAETFCPEPVHPYLIGHMALAEAVYSILSK
jgi:lysophospholipase L1-like esterase